MKPPLSRLLQSGFAKARAAPSKLSHGSRNIAPAAGVAPASCGCGFARRARRKRGQNRTAFQERTPVSATTSPYFPPFLTEKKILKIKLTIERILRAYGMLEKFRSDELFYAKIENPPYLDLSIERHGNRITLSHYAKCNGDLIPDPDMEFVIMPNENWMPVAIQLNTGHYQRALQFSETGALFSYFPKALSSQISFSNMWAKNLISQGFHKARLAKSDQP